MWVLVGRDHLVTMKLDPVDLVRSCERSIRVVERVSVPLFRSGIPFEQAVLITLLLIFVRILLIQ